MKGSPVPPTGLVAILRGVTPRQVLAVGLALADEGFRAIEVPLNSPDPFRSIEVLVAGVGHSCRVGAGTVLHVDDVARADGAGAQFIVSPNTDDDVIATAVTRGLRPYPGVATTTEAFRAIAAGARSLKLFPACSLGTSGARALRAVLPTEIELLPVGGVDERNLAEWAHAGAEGAGLGTSLYRPGDLPDHVRAKARTMLNIWSAALAERKSGH